MMMMNRLYSQVLEVMKKDIKEKVITIMLKMAK